MLRYRIAFFALLLCFFILILGFGCNFIPPITEKNTTIDPLATCTSSCARQFPNTVGSIENGTCKCPCVDGYKRFAGVCYPPEDYAKLLPGICDSNCKNTFPHSFGSVKDGNCTCPCSKGFVGYNKTCISPDEFKKLAPTLCPTDKPVLKIYDWTFKRKSYYIYLCYGSDVHEDLSENRTGRRDYWNFVGDPNSEKPVALISNVLNNISNQEGFDKNDKINLAIAFVQSLPYTYDNVTTPYDDYPRYPAETIFADGGDCEDTSILMAAVLKNLGYGVVLLHLPHHVAAGVACNPSDFNYTVAAYPYNGTEYCYLETTGENWKIGQLPDSHAGQEVEVIPLRGLQPDLYIGYGYTFSSHHDSRNTYVDVTGIRIDNYGELPAKNVKIRVSLESSDGSSIDSYTYTAGDIPSRGYYNYHVTNLRVASGAAFRVHIEVFGDNFTPAETRSEWAKWK